MSETAVLNTATESNESNPIRCDKCNSPYAIDPAKRKKGNNLSKPKFRKWMDATANKILTLCNKCGLSMSRKSKRPPKKPVPTEEEKQSYLVEAEAFAASLAERLNEPDAKRLYCPNVTPNPCSCLQKYIQGEGKEESLEADERAFNLIQLLNTAKNLSTEKMHTVHSNAIDGNTSQKEDTVLCRGVGNRHSKTFEEFVLSKRQYLRGVLKFCERASQRVLIYSNNFLHKKLKSVKNRRIEHKNGKYAKGVLKSIADLPFTSCCNDCCVQQAATQPNLLESWRLDAFKGQKEARRVVAEMLDHPGGSQSNCYRFISLVTGCSLTTICAVNKHMKRTSGSKDPPEHGLKRWWQDNPKKRRKKETSLCKKVPRIEDTSFGDEDGKLEDRVGVSGFITPRSSLPPPSYETALCTKEAVMQLESQKQPMFEMEGKDEQELQLQQHGEIMEPQVQQIPHQSILSTSSFLQNTIQHLLMSHDISAVTVVAAPKPPSKPVQIVTMQDVPKEDVLPSQMVESGQGMVLDNTCQVNQPCQAVPMAILDMKQGMLKDKFGTESTHQLTSEKMANCQSSPVKPVAESIQRRQILHVFDLPYSESLPPPSAMPNFVDKSSCQLLSIVSTPELESGANATMSEQGGGSCMRSIILLPETFVIDSGSLGPSKSTKPICQESHQWC